MDVFGAKNLYNPSQSLFPSSGQLFNDLDPISTPVFPTQRQPKPFDILFSEKFSNKTSGNDISTTSRVPKFSAPVPKVDANDVDVDHIFDFNFSQSSISTSPSLTKQNKSRCFQVPFSQKYLNESNSLKKVGNYIQSNQELTSESVNKVEDFINRCAGSSGQKIAGVTPVSYKKPSSPVLTHKGETTHPRFIPETPCLEKPTSPINKTAADFNDDLIVESDDECRGAIYGPTLQTPGRLKLPPVTTPHGTVMRDGMQLRSTDEIPYRYRSVFDDIPYFNIVQSKVFEDAFYCDKSLVVCAPTGSGKTVIFELAIIRLLMKNEDLALSGKRKKKTTPKIVYMAPMKALCFERCEDWSQRFHSLGLACQELTGDTDVDDFWQLQKSDIILTTPEKWDSMTRRWRDNSSLVRQVQLFLIDEVHHLNDEGRGATMEAVVSRMKTIQNTVCNVSNMAGQSELRFVAVSATIPNTEDIAEWLGTPQCPAVSFAMDDSYRPVALRKVVLGYPWSSNGSEFKFDISLNYKLGNVIHTYSEDKPTLVFCSTRKSVEQAASTLVKDTTFVINASHKQTLIKHANLVRNHRLRELLQKGVGYHHAGLDSGDRRLVEELFTQGDLLVLFSTSTLAMGVNLPAHLVVIKSTSHYVQGMFQEYSQSEILQMIGRAGRPQFDTSATAVIMTRNESRNLYHNLVSGSQKIESSLHKHLIEHLNAEIVLSTIHDVTIALEWIRSTFLYIRLLKNPTHYGCPKNLNQNEAERRLHELCMNKLGSLAATNLVSIDDELRLLACEAGKLMARYSIAFETIKKFGKLSGKESVSEMIEILSGCSEFQDLNLRMNERSTLNKMNKDKNRVTIRYPYSGRIKTTQMKVGCLLQATLGCITVQDFTLTQDVTKIFRNGMRVSRCLVELLFLKDDFKSLHSASLLAKCIKARLWENSRYVTKQLPNIGTSLSNAFANAGVCSFEKLESTDPREIELIVNRHPPFGNVLLDAVKALPKYAVHVEQSKRYAVDTCDITVKVQLSNAAHLKEKNTAGKKHGCLLLIGDADNKAILKQRLSDTQLLTTAENTWSRTLTVMRAQKGDELSVNLISHEWVGLDVESTYSPYYLGPRRMVATTAGVRNDVSAEESKYFKKKKMCRHSCSNKRTCGHDCCKVGANTSAEVTETNNHTSPQNHQNMKGDRASSVDYLQRYKFNPRSKSSAVLSTNQVVPSTPSLPRTKGWEYLDSFCDLQQTQDGVRDEEILEKMSSFEREQANYSEQINLGSRIKHSEGMSENKGNGLVRKRGSEQLWTHRSFDQNESGSDLADDIEEIKPRQPKYGFTKVQTREMGNKGLENSTPTRMGKVFAWKTTTTPRRNVLTYQTSVQNVDSPTVTQLQSQRRNHFDPGQPTSSYGHHGNNGAKHENSPSSYNSYGQKCSKLTQSQAPFLDRNNDSGYFSTPSAVFSQRNDQAVTKDALQQSATFSPRVQDCNQQLWEQAPSCDYPSFSLSSKKKVTFKDELMSSGKSASQILPFEEDDVSIDCDFSLEESTDAEDLLMMEACLQAEDIDNQPMSEEIARQDVSQPDPKLRSSEYVTYPATDQSQPRSQIDPSQFHPQVSSYREPAKSQYTSFFNSETSRKDSEVADARKMFDSIFSGIF